MPFLHTNNKKAIKSKTVTTPTTTKVMVTLENKKNEYQRFLEMHDTRMRCEQYEKNKMIQQSSIFLLNDRIDLEMMNLEESLRSTPLMDGELAKDFAAIKREVKRVTELTNRRFSKMDGDFARRTLHTEESTQKDVDTLRHSIAQELTRTGFPHSYEIAQLMIVALMVRSADFLHEEHHRDARRLMGRDDMSLEPYHIVVQPLLDSMQHALSLRYMQRDIDSTHIDRAYDIFIRKLFRSNGFLKDVS